MRPALQSIVSLDASLRPGVLELGVDPDVHVFVNLHDEGFGTRRLELPSGRHHVELLRPGFRPWRRELVLPPGDTLRVAPRDFEPDTTARDDSAPGRMRGC